MQDTSKLWLTDALEDDVYSAFVRCLRIVEPLEQLSGRRGLSLSPQDDVEGAVRRWLLGVASGLWLLVLE